MKINEGLKTGDLENLCLNTISIDQFKSKISDDCIVVAFYVLYLNPAKDLNSFIQKTAIDIVDTEVSPAPTEDGYYVVFVELPRNENFYDSIIHLIDSVKNLTSVDEWFFRCFNTKDALKLQKDNLEKYIDIPKTIKEKIYYYFKNSDVEDIKIENNKLFLKRNNNILECDFVAYGKNEKLFEKFDLYHKPYSITESSFSLQNKIKDLLGLNWDINIIENKMILSKLKSDKSIIIKAG